MQPKIGIGKGLSAEMAEKLAIQAIAFVAGDPTRLGRFLAESGLGPENVRRAARDPSFLPAVLDFILAHETDLLDLAAEIGIDPKYIGAARRALSGEKFKHST